MPMFFINSSHKLRLCKVAVRSELGSIVQQADRFCLGLDASGSRSSDTGCRHAGTGIGSCLDKAAGNASALIGGTVNHHAIHLLAAGAYRTRHKSWPLFGFRTRIRHTRPAVSSTPPFNIHRHHGVILTTLAHGAGNCPNHGGHRHLKSAGGPL